MHPHLARISVFPVKSLDGQSVSEAAVLRSGALSHDREYALVDAEGALLNTKRLGEDLVRIRSEVDFAFGEISLTDHTSSDGYHIEREQGGIESWLAGRLRQPVRLVRDTEKGFPDDDQASGPTVVSTKSLKAVAGWFGLHLDEVRRRFRANLEIDGVEAFWEDRLYGAGEGGAGEGTVTFRIGEVAFEGVNPCARCTVPPRDSKSGEIPEPSFAKIFAEKRQQTLPAWAEPSRFDHYYRFAVNTRVPETEAGKVLYAGDTVYL